MASSGQEKSGTMVELSRKLKKLAKDDPRRIIHSLKMALAITLVSLFFYFKPLYDGFGVSAIWAVLTVVVVFEFSVGATLGRGLNRMLATLLAGGLGLGAHRIATFSGETGEPILISVFVFIVAAIVTFLRFIPNMKARYDYGLMIFVLTFCLVSVSGYRDDEVIHMAFKRVTTILIGSAASVIICILICPVWIGEELHKHVARNLDKLGEFLEGFADEYFEVAERSTDKSFLEGYKSILTSKSSEESMANLAKWEPRHGRFRLSHPWKQYLRIANLTRQCAYKIEALHSYLESETQTPIQERTKIQETCKAISSECGKALKEMASTIKKMKKSTGGPHIAASKSASESLKATIRSGIWKDHFDLLELTPAATVASLLLQIGSCVEAIARAVRELESLARFDGDKPRVTPETDQPQPHDLVDDHAIAESAHKHDYVIEIDTQDRVDDASDEQGQDHDNVIDVDGLSETCSDKSTSHKAGEGSHVP